MRCRLFWRVAASWTGCVPDLPPTPADECVELSASANCDSAPGSSFTEAYLLWSWLDMMPTFVLFSKHAKNALEGNFHDQTGYGTQKWVLREAAYCFADSSSSKKSQFNFWLRLRCDARHGNASSNCRMQSSKHKLFTCLQRPLCNKCQERIFEHSKRHTNWSLKSHIMWMVLCRFGAFLI